MALAQDPRLQAAGAMNWLDLVGPLVKLGAPMLGQALGGPLGAAAGKIVADTFGASEPTPE